MKRVLQGLVLAGLVAGCARDPTQVDDFSVEESKVIRSLSSLGDPPPDTTNHLADDPRAATLGQKLFFDTAFSGPLVVGNDGTNGALGNVGDVGKVACASCHQPDAWMNDRRSHPNNTALGTNWMIRNASTAINSSFYKVWCENDGVRDSQWSDALTDPEDPTSMNGSRLKVAHVLYAKYRTEYNALFATPLDPDLDPASPNASRFPPNGKPKASPTDPDGPWELMAPADRDIVNRIFSNFGKAVQAYVRKLVSKNAPFDQYVAGNYKAISSSAKNGLKLFIGKGGCVQCHSGPIFSDSKFHNTGLKAVGDHIIPTETGRYDAIGAVLGIEFNSDGAYSDDQHTGRLTGLAATDADKGRWRTKQLRTIAETAPYMHTGQLATLQDVVQFYNRGGDDSGYVGTKDTLIQPLHLTDQEVTDLVNFLGTLTGDPLPSALVQNTSNP